MGKWQTADIQKAKTLGGLLALKRDDLEGTPGELVQEDIAQAIGFSQSYVSKIERGGAEKRIPLWPSAKQLALLRVYKFTDAEIVEIAGKFELDIGLPSGTLPPADVKNLTLQPLSQPVNLDIAVIKSLRNSNEDGQTLLTLQQLGDHQVGDCFTIIAGGSVLACDKVKQKLDAGDTAYFDKTLEPRDGDIIAYRVQVENVERYLMAKHQLLQPLGWITSYDGSVAVYIREGEPQLEFLGVQWWGHPPQRNG